MRCYNLCNALKESPLKLQNRVCTDKTFFIKRDNQLTFPRPPIPETLKSVYCAFPAGNVQLLNFNHQVDACF